VADRTFGRDALLLADIPGSGTGPVLITIIDPTGATLVNAGVATLVGGNRFSYVLPASLQTTTGFYQLTWVGSVRSVTQLVTLDYQPAAGMTKYRARLQAAHQVGKVVFGHISSISQTFVADNALIGGADEYIYWYMMLNPTHPDAGIVKTVVDFNGTALVIDSDFSVDPVEGEEYVLFNIDPREIDEHLSAAITELSPTAHIPIKLSNFVLTDSTILLPEYVSHIYLIYDDNDKISPLTWRAIDGRRIQFDTDPSGTITVMGLRSAGTATWDDSILETNPAATVALTAFHLHQNRASGQALDFEEHLRRQIAAEQTAERIRRNAVSRLPPGTRAIVP
jgi:hypothetical protein